METLTQRARPPRSPDAWTAYLLAGPGILLMAVLVILPAAGVLIIALTDWQIGAPSLNFVGFGNFLSLARDPVFVSSFVNTLTYMLVVVPVTLVLSLIVALSIEGSGRFRSLYRSVHFLPVMATFSAMAVAWEAMLHPTIGLINLMLRDYGLPQSNWLRDPSLVLPTLMVVGIWQQLGYAVLLFIAALKSVPTELYEAADLDGADGPLDRLATVTLPMLGPAGMFIIVIISMRALQTFDSVAVLTKGGPGSSSELLLHTLYVESFQYFRTGYGAAMTVVFLILVIGLTFLQTRILDRRIHYT
ncbi:carbohydrate ABC transporter permease [Pseudochelatococcus sp. B33]